MVSESDRALKASLGRALAARPPKAAPKTRPATKAEKIGKASAAKIEKAMRAASPDAVDLVVSRDAQRHGNYQVVDFGMVEIYEGKKLKTKATRVIRNLGGTPIERWHARGKLDPRQMAAILFYQQAWRMWIGEPRVVAGYSPVIVRGAQGALEVYAGSRIAAKEGLRLLDQEVFFRLPVDHFQVWQNVVIWDEPAGVAGSRIGFCHKPAEAVAQMMIATMASMIADIVIDSARRDFGDLLVDIDAPRRAGKRRA